MKSTPRSRQLIPPKHSFVVWQQCYCACTIAIQLLAIHPPWHQWHNYNFWAPGNHLLRANSEKGKGKRSIAVRKKPHRYGNSHATWDHTVLPGIPATRQQWHSRLYPSRSWYSIKRPRRDARLSWPSWLATARDGIPTRRRSPIPVVTGPDVR